GRWGWRGRGWRQARSSGCDWSCCAKRLKLPNRDTEQSSEARGRLGLWAGESGSAALGSERRPSPEPPHRARRADCGSDQSAEPETLQRLRIEETAHDVLGDARNVVVVVVVRQRACPGDRAGGEHGTTAWRLVENHVTAHQGTGLTVDRRIGVRQLLLHPVIGSREIRRYGDD